MGNFLDALNSTDPTTTSSYDPNLTENKGMEILDNFDNMVKSTVYADNPEQGTNVFAPGKMETSDPSRISTGTHSLVSNMWNSFLQGIDQTQMITARGKMFIDKWGHDGAEAIILRAPDRIKTLDDQLAKGLISQTEHDNSLEEINKNVEEAQRDMISYQNTIDENQREIDNEPVDKEYMWKSAMLQSQGDQGGALDKFKYTFPNTAGSSTSLMGLSLAATFGNKATQYLIKQGLKAGSAAIWGEALGPEVGVPVQAIAAVGGFLGSAIELGAARILETYGEVGQSVQTVRENLIKKYLEDHPLLKSAGDIPEEDMRQMKLMSLNGANKQYLENMALMVPDVVGAIAMPLGNFGLGLSKSFKFAGGIEKLVESAKNYNKLSRLLFTAGKFYTEAAKEKFEEGFQQAAQYRAEDQTNKYHDYNPKEGIISSIMGDGYDTFASLNYSLIPGIDLRGDGRYSKDNEFQFSENSGGALSLLLGGIPAAVATAKDIMAYRHANKDVQDNGLVDIDGKIKRLSNSVMLKYFDKDEIHHLGEAVKTYAGKMDDDGAPYMTKEEATAVIDHMKDSYEIYQAVGNRLSNIKGDKLGGLFTSGTLKAARQMVKEDYLNAVTNMVNKKEAAAKAFLDADNLAAKEEEIFNTKPEVEAANKEYANKKAAIEELLNAKSYNIKVNNTFVDWRANLLKDKMQELNEFYKDNKESLDYEPSQQVVDAYKAAYAHEIFHKDYAEKVEKLNSIKNSADLYHYLQTNLGKPIGPDMQKDLDEEDEKIFYAEDIANKIAANTPLTPEETTWRNDKKNAQAVEDILKQKATTAATPQAQTQDEESPKTDEDEGEVDIMQQVIHDILGAKSDIPTKARDLDKLMRGMNPSVDITQGGLPAFMNGMRQVFDDKPNYIREHFDTIQAIFKTLTPSTPTYGLAPDLSLYTIGEIPPTQNDELDINKQNKNFLDNYIESVEEPKGTGDKITSGLSLAQKNILTRTLPNGKIVDLWENGELQFSDQYDQQLNNTNVVNTGDKVELQIINLPDNFDFNDKSDINYDKVQIGIFKTIGGQRRLINYLHEVSALDRLLADTINDERELDKEAEKDLCRQNRRAIIEAGLGPVFSGDIVSKGFGHLNLNARGIATTIHNAFGRDSRPMISYVDENGDAVSVFGETIVQAAAPAGSTLSGSMKPGATIILLPNDTDNGRVYVPIYLIKRQLSADPEIHKIVTKAVTEFLVSRTRKSLDKAAPYVFLSSKDSHKLDMGLRGIYATARNGNFEVSIDGESFYTNKLDGLEEAIAKVYFSVDKSQIKNADYQNTLKKSGLLLTNVVPNPVLLTPEKFGKSPQAYDFLSDDDKYSYFSQHTIVIGSIAKSGELIAPTTTTETAETTEDIDEFLSGIPLDELDVTPKKGKLAKLADKLGIITNDALEDSQRSRLLVSPNIPASLQHEMTRSIAFKLLNEERPNDKDAEQIKNVDKVKAWVASKYNELNDAKDKISDKNRAIHTRVLNNYRLLHENIDAIIQKSRELLDGLGFKYDEDTDYYENLEDKGEDNGFTQFQEDSNSTLDQREFLPKEVKKLIYFIPKLTPEMKEGKPTGNYIEEKNVLGLPTFNNFNDTWEKTLEITTSLFFDATNSGFQKMLTTLQNKSNAAVVQEVAKQLQKAPEQVQNAFFRRVKLQKQVNISGVYDVKAKKRGGVRKYMSIFQSDKRQGIKRTVGELYDQFLTANTGMLVPKRDEHTGANVFTVNTKFAKDIREQIEAILANPTSYAPTDGRDRGRKGNSLSDTAARQIHLLIKQIGINMSYLAFKDLITYHRTTVAGSSREASIIREIFVQRILSRLAGEGRKSSRKEHAEEAGDVTYDDLRGNNPFTDEKQSIEAIARQEYKQRQNTQSGSYYFDGKSYYAFTRPNYLSEFFTKINEFKATGVDNFIRAKLETDTYAKTSIYLQGLMDPTQDMGLGLYYELGSRNNASDMPSKQLKEMNEREHTVTRLAWYQNGGSWKGYFLYDTLSDKTTKPAPTAKKFDVSGLRYDTPNVISFASKDIERLYNAHFLNEYNRIKEVQEQNRTLPAYKKIKGYHGEKGMGQYFLTFYFMNKDFLMANNPKLARDLYNDDNSLKDIEGPLKGRIFDEINKHMNKVVQKNKKDLLELGLYDLDAVDDKGRPKPNLTDLIDHNYMFAGDSPVERRLGLDFTPGMKEAAHNGDWSKVPRETLDRIVDFVVADYVYNSIVFSNEMMLITGDPAQAGKQASKDTLAMLKKMYEHDPMELKKQTLLAHIQSTYVNLGKRNAAFLASGEGGKFKDTHYNVAIAEDINTSSLHLDYYTAKFGAGAYDNDEGMTDAQEVTTVKEFLSNMEAYGMIDEDKYAKALFIFDKDQYNEDLKRGLVKEVRPSGQERIELTKLIMQPQKPVQRTYNIDRELGISKQYYIKTSAYPLIPSLLDGSMKALLEDMKREVKDENGIVIRPKVDRIAFVTGVKQGVAGAKKIFDKNGAYNPEFLSDNVNTLHRNGFRIQLEVPFKEYKDHIREGTQQSKLLFVDTPDTTPLEYRGSTRNAGELKDMYIDYHKQIVDHMKKEFYEEIGVSDINGQLSMGSLKKLAQILQREGDGRGYAMNSLLGLDLTPDGQFKVPLTFLPNAGQIEPVITALISNHITRLKMPGKSYVLGSEFTLKTGKRGEIRTDEKLKDMRGIVWTKPEYEGMEKLGYLHKDEAGKVKHAQIIMPFYFIKGKEMLDVKHFTTEIDGRTFLDTSKVDPELLQMNGFRIPFQGLNSGMWFEIVGFVPKTMGDLVIVPAEIGGQMGSDYDVDKLYSYMYNYRYKKEGNPTKDISFERMGADEEEWEALKRKARLKLADQGVSPINSQTNEYDRVAFNKALGEVVSEVYPEGNVPKHKVTRQTKNEEYVEDTSPYEINKIDNATPHTVAELQNALIDIQKAIYTAADEDIHNAVLEQLSFKDMEETIKALNLGVSSEFLGSFDPTYQRDVYFSNITGKIGTAISANANTSHAMAQGANLFIKGQGVLFLDEKGNPYTDYMAPEKELPTGKEAEKKALFDKAIRDYLADFQGYDLKYYKGELEVAHKIIDSIAWSDQTKASDAYTELQRLLGEADETMNKETEDLNDAHNSIAAIMYHLVNMIKGNSEQDRVLIDERIRLTNPNAINDTYVDTYKYYDNEDEPVDQNQKDNGAWRLDKIWTFADPITGKRYRISNLISQILGISVDNAKEQKLGALGINKLNFNVALGIIRTGFSPNYMAAFINQPILKEYYTKIGEADDIYRVDYTPNKKEKAVADLFDKYSKMYGIKEDVQSNKIFEGHKLSDMVSWLSSGITAKNAKDQLYILKAFIRYKEATDGIQAVTSAFNIDAKGLPKNMSETAAKMTLIANTSDSPVLGNVYKYKRTTIPGIFLDVPSLAVKIFMNENSPIFAYNSQAYTTAREELMRKTGRGMLTQEQTDKIHQHIKQFIYSGLAKNVTEIRLGLLFDTPGNESLQTRLTGLRDKNPRNEFLNTIKEVGSIFPDDPKLVEIPFSTEEDYTDKVSELWEQAINSADPDIQTFAKDLVNYALYVSPQEYGQSNIIRYVPFKYREDIGFHEYLRNTNARMNNENELVYFPDQFLEHNIDFLVSARESNVVPGSIIRGQGEIINGFTLPLINEHELAKNAASNLVRADKNGLLSYPEYLSMYNDKEFGKQMYRRTDSTEGVSYLRIEQKGMDGMSEYVYNEFVPTIVDTKKVRFSAPQTNSSGVASLMGVANLLGEAPRETGEYLLANRSADQILAGVARVSQDILSNPSATKMNREYAKLYNFLAIQLQNMGLDGTTITLDENHPTAATASMTNGATSVIFNPVRIMSSKRTGLSAELEKERIILHELLHVAIYKNLREKGKNKSYKAIEDVWNAYRENIWKESNKKMERLPSLPVSVFDAELFNILKTEFDENKGSELGNRDFIEHVSATINDTKELERLLEKMGDRLRKLHEEGKIAQGNFDLVSNKARAQEFKSYIVNQFMDNIGDHTNKYYAYHDIYEFVSEALTNRVTQDLLKAMPSIWERLISSIKQFLSDIFGIESDERTLFNDAFDAVFNFLKPGQKSVPLPAMQSNFERRTSKVTNAEVKANPRTLYVFGDNNIRRGLGGQAAEMRGEPNAFGISTKKLPTNDEAQKPFMSDAELEANKKVISDDVNKIIEAWRSGKYDKLVVPQIGVGLAQLPTRAPATWAFLNKELDRLKSEVDKDAKTSDEIDVQISRLIAQGILKTKC